jgi:hypothetical protein
VHNTSIPVLRSPSSKEKAMKKPIVSFDRVYQRTSKALGVSYTSVHRIMNGKSPCKSNRPKKELKFWTTLIIVLLLAYFLHILQKMQNITIIYERNAC